MYTLFWVDQSLYFCRLDYNIEKSKEQLAMASIAL